MELTDQEKEVLLKGLEALNRSGVSLQDSAFLLKLFEKVKDGAGTSDSD